MSGVVEKAVTSHPRALAKRIAMCHSQPIQMIHTLSVGLILLITKGVNTVAPQQNNGQAELASMFSGSANVHLSCTRTLFANHPCLQTIVHSHLLQRFWSQETH
ncbi:hypothetical protein GW750_07115 [bacterium]|nr:hypothetical protein [bacterium]